MRRLLALVLVLVGATLAFGLTRAGVDTLPRASQALVPTPTPQPEPYRAVSGRLVSLANGVVTVEDGEGRHSVAYTAETQIRRGAGYVFVTDNDASRLHLGDSLFVEAIPSESLFAKVITANAFIGRDGLVAASGPDYLDVHLRPDRLATEYEDQMRRFYIDPSATIEQIGPDMRKTIEFRDMSWADNVHIQGFIADDGALVALLIWRFGNPR